ncbi:hypothetical protein [Myxococcus sp. Y35]
MNTKTKVHQVKELFVQDLARGQGGPSKPASASAVLTTTACGEEVGGGC